jgi:hypothetical protein
MAAEPAQVPRRRNGLEDWLDLVATSNARLFWRRRSFPGLQIHPFGGYIQSDRGFHGRHLGSPRCLLALRRLA